MDRPARQAGAAADRAGLGWLALTLGFEFSFGLLRGRTLDEILAAYRFEGGNLWALVLLVTACAPWLVGWLRRR